jgi:hypothetical protein
MARTAAPRGVEASMAALSQQGAGRTSRGAQILAHFDRFTGACGVAARPDAYNCANASTRERRMRNFRLPALAALLAAYALALPAGAQTVMPCKNHYILRCAPDDLSLGWKALADPSLSYRSGHTATVLPDGRVLAIGGARWVFDPETRTSSIAGPFGAEIFDPAAGSWELTAAPNRLRMGHLAVRLLDGRVLVLGGDLQATTLPGPLLDLHATAELFDPTTGRWSPTNAPLVARSGATATLLLDGRVLVAGGVDRDDVTQPSAEVYDPATGNWRFTGPLVEPRLSHTATALPDGRVLVVGGMTDDFFMTPTGSAETFDPATETWSAAGAIEPRWLHTATLTEEGTVVVAGGYISVPGRNGGYYVDSDVRSSEIYDVSTGTWTGAGDLSSPRHRHLAVRLRGHGVLLFGGRTPVTPIPAYTERAVEPGEFLSRGETLWRDALTAPVSSSHYHSATELPDGSVLFLGDLDGARAALLRAGEATR